MATEVVKVELERIACGECGGAYALNARYVQQRREEGGFWNCPYCQCNWGFPRNGSELARLKRKLEYTEADAMAAREQRDRNERRRRAEKAAKTRLRNRVANGVCPCCSRHFTNLERHIQSQHPEFTGNETGTED